MISARPEYTLKDTLYLQANVMKNLLLCAALLWCNIAFADAPLTPPVPWKVCDRSISFCAYIDPKAGTTVYKIEPPFAAQEIYKIPGWHRWARIADDGQFFITAYSGLNLVPLDVQPTQVMLTFWKNGAKHKEVTLGQIIKNWTSLQPTASHYRWGEVSHLSKDTIHLKTVEGTVTVNMETGVVSFP
jgi:hypothetical protein